jgi:hypothetical protein
MILAHDEIKIRITINYICIAMHPLSYTMGL